MNQFVLRNTSAGELRLFPHIAEIGIVKNTAIRLAGFPNQADGHLRFYYIQDGKFEWTICGNSYVLYPGDAAIILPGMELGHPDEVLQIGTFLWINLCVGAFDGDEPRIGSWTSLSPKENAEVLKALLMDRPAVLPKFTEGGDLLKSIQKELFGREACYQSRVNHLLDDILILVARQCSHLANPGRNFPKTFMELEKELRGNLSHQWTVEEMAALVGMGTTLFNERVKVYSGFSPLSYLINIRISEAIKLLKNVEVSLTDIALDTGFYSSQHFSTTFKKLTGYTPSQFRKNHSRPR
ncbi:MAG: AraC family transcriptional regulator [Chitinophagaceae bacterium]|nr:MAG: AraC family transcriptional regulator [Chitinophagaceae bacterium]